MAHETEQTPTADAGPVDLGLGASAEAKGIGGTMNEGDFFVMLNTQGGSYAPLMDDDEIARFKTEAEARACAAENLLGAHFGFEVFERGAGTRG